MTSSLQISGLASGLDTASIISSLMSVEAQPQTTLKTRVSNEQTQVSALQALNSSIASLSTMADSFRTGSTWTQLTATSSNSAMSVTATSSALPATVSLNVTQSASSSMAILSAAGVGGLTAGSTYTITSGSTSTSFTIGGTGSLSDIAAAVNGTTKTSGLRAVIIDPSGSSPTLELVSTATGAASNFAITDASGAKLVDTASSATAAANTANTSGITTSAGQDAQLTVDGVAMTSASNTVTVMTGVQVTIPTGISASGDPVSSTIAVTDDGSSRATAIKTFVDQINSVLQSITTQTAYGTITAGTTATGAGVLAGNMDLRDVSSQLLNTIFPKDGTSMASMGLDVDSDGNLTFDADKFAAAYQADPTGVQKAFVGDLSQSAGTDTTDSFISRVKKVADAASDSYSGTITASINSMNDEISNYNDQISDWDDRLAAKQASLEAYYTNLETVMSKLTSQQTWLTSALSSLDSGWSQND